MRSDTRRASGISPGFPAVCHPGAQANEVIAAEGCFTSEEDDHEVALFAQKSGMRTSWGHRLFSLR
jgi:hypothetical protein